MLELRDLCAGYGSTQVLRGVNLVVPERSVVALLGANGAGKTTLLRVAAGLLRPTGGELIVDGTTLRSPSPHLLNKAGVCHVPEGRGIWKSLSVRDHLMLYALSGREKEAVERAVDAFPKLGQRLSQSAGTMSGGEQQMLALARAYIQSPKLVLLDEVSLGLAPAIIDDIFAFIGQLAHRGASLLIVEQYVHRALAIADYAYILSRGQVTFAGEPGELSDHAVFQQYLGTEVAGV